MQTEWIILADFAEVLNGKLYTMGAGWDKLTVNAIPASQAFAVGASFLVDWNETNQRHIVEILLTDEDERRIATLSAHLEVGRPPGSIPGQTQRVMLAANLHHNFEYLGTYVVKTQIESVDSARLTFNVVPGPQLLAEQLMGPKGDKPSN
jgi:hypothetical protein